MSREYIEEANGKVIKLHEGVDIIGVTKTFATKERTVQALAETNLHVRSKEFVTLLGTSGCGKSTLLRMIGGLEHPSTGKIMFKKEEITNPGADIGMVFQSYTLFPWMTVEKNIVPPFDTRRANHGYEKHQHLYLHCRTWQFHKSRRAFGLLTVYGLISDPAVGGGAWHRPF